MPTGIVAGRYGRKLSLALSAVIASAVWLVYASPGDFVVMAIAQFIGGIAATFSSGANEALLYETMKALRREDEYAKISGRARAVKTVSAIVSGIVVGVIASFDLALPAVITSILIGASLLPILSFTETGGTYRARSGQEGSNATEEGEQPSTGYGQIVRAAFVALREHAILRWALAYLVILSSVGFYSEVFLQPYAVSVGVPVALLGIVMTAVLGMGIVGSLAVPAAQRAAGSGAVIFDAPVLLIPCLLLLGVFPTLPVIVMAAVAAFLFAVAQPVLLAVVQSRVTDYARATVLSIQSFLATVFLTATEPFLGVLSDRFGVHTSYLAMAVLVGLFCVLLLLRGRRWLSRRSPAAGTAQAVTGSGR
jgi:MFS family permease